MKSFFEPQKWTDAERILATRAYFAVFKRELTDEELSQWCLGGKLQHAMQRTPIQAEHLGRSKLYDHYWRFIKRWNWLWRFLPFVRAVYICNYFKFGILDEESDIDLFIVAAKDRIFTAKFLVTVVTSILGIRRHGNKIKRRFCLSFWVNEDFLDLRRFLLHPYDIYFYYWLIALMPLWGKPEILTEVVKKNFWIREYLHLDENLLTPANQRKSSLVSIFVEKLFAGKIGQKLENYLRRRALSKLAQKQTDSPNRSVMISDQHLKYHENDRRAEFRRLFEVNLQRDGFTRELGVDRFVYKIDSRS